MTLFKTSVLSLFATVSKLLFGFVVVKLLALYSGASGVAIYGQFHNLFMTVSGLATLGMKNSVVKYVSENRTDLTKKTSFLSTVFILSILSIVTISFILYFGSDYISEVVFQNNTSSWYVSLIAVVLFFAVYGVISLSILNAEREIKKYSLVLTLTHIAGIAISIYLVPKYGTEGAIYTFIVTQVLVFGIAVAYLKTSEWWDFKVLFQGYDSEELNKIFRFTIMALSNALIVPLSHIYVRNMIENELSLEAAGIWTGMWKVSEAYLLVITMTMTVYFLPKFSEENSVDKINNELIRGLKYLVTIASIMAITIYYLRDIVVLVLFTEEFMPMVELFAYQLMGDVIKVVAWLYGFILVAKAMMYRYVMVNIVLGLTFIIAMEYFVKEYGLIGTGFAFIVNGIVNFILVYVIYRGYCAVERGKQLNV